VEKLPWFSFQIPNFKFQIPKDSRIQRFKDSINAKRRGEFTNPEKKH
jgi:hypothetical protein